MTGSGVEALFELDAPHYSAGVYTLAPPDTATMAQVCRLLQDGFEARALAARVAVSDTFPRFAGFAHGVGVPVETTRVNDLTEAVPSGRQLLAGSFDVPDVGRVLAEFFPIDPVEVAHTHQPIGVTINGTWLDLWGSLERKEQIRADRQAAFLLKALRGLTERFDPVFGAIVAEEPIPTPSDLKAGGMRSGDVYLSDRLIAADSKLASLLATAYATGYTEQWRFGRYFSSWGAFNPVGVDSDSPFTVDSDVSLSLGGALAALSER